MKTTKKCRGEIGVSLIETLVAVALLGIAVVFIVNGLGTLSRSNRVLDEQAIVEGMARSQIESIKSQDYIGWLPEHAEYTPMSAPAGYSIATSVVPIDPATGVALTSGTDNGVQKISVTISRGEDTLLTLTGYKIDR